MRESALTLWTTIAFLIALTVQPLTAQEQSGPPSPAAAQVLWVGFWSALARGDLREAEALAHPSIRPGLSELVTPEGQSLARAFLRCSIATEAPVVNAERASYGTRCFDDSRTVESRGGSMVLAREGGTWWVLCFGC